jgi:hypothetical protein
MSSRVVEASQAGETSTERTLLTTRTFPIWMMRTVTKNTAGFNHVKPHTHTNLNLGLELKTILWVEALEQRAGQNSPTSASPWHAMVCEYRQDRMYLDSISSRGTPSA